MAEARINREIAKSLPSDEVPRGSVCKATVDQWDEFQELENQEVRSSCMELIEGDIYIVELPTSDRETFISEMRLAILCQPAVQRYLKCYGSAYSSNRSPNQPRLQADESYGLRRETGSLLPQGVPNFGAWQCKVGTHSCWKLAKRERGGTTPGMLDWKAQRWAGILGVRFVLCVAVTDKLATAEYELYTVRPPARRLRIYRAEIENLDQDPVSIVAPRTEVRFDARALLGLQPGGPVPRDPPTPSGAVFPDPLVVDLCQVLADARR
ncbi:hypothetical protein P3T76_007061 [Phytophthora citrophthora]|uniref:Uncharacterized protein n=1 Tax=Phytophthora citrophthora TaxID=4793 RepID=A0AAD9LLL9_9STRA|nr:hypothetical protein P3T76_007061 [Phytophthora citrophthora]